MKIKSISAYKYKTKAFLGNKEDDTTSDKKFDSGTFQIKPLNYPTYSYAFPYLSHSFSSINQPINFPKIQFPAEITDPILRNRAEIAEQRKLAKSDGFSKKISHLKKQSEKTLDMEKIKSIILPPVEKSQLRSFENSDKKFILDTYQSDAIDAFVSGKNIIITAPTGTGKTLIAEYGIEDALKKGKRIIYLSPLKALSNEKFVKFSELFGRYDKNGNSINSENVGIITGDIIINPDAQLLIMTTEIYRNMVNVDDEVTTAEAFKDFSAVIYDEFHYLNDPDRGTVWEESVMQTPRHMQQMMLSATASNAKTIAQWLQITNPEKETALIDVPENERYVPLKEYCFGFDGKDGYVIRPLYQRKIDIEYVKSLNSDRLIEIIEELEQIFDGKDFLEILTPLADENGLIDTDTFSEMLISQKGLTKEKAEQIAHILSNPDRTKKTDIRLNFAPKNPPIVNLVKVLHDKNKTPALFFIFSKKKCKKELDEVSKKLGTLLTPEESKRVLDVIQEAKEKEIYLGEDFDEEYLPKLLMGYAVHHAGMLPAYKSLVEKLSREGLVKACFATETLLAGINMPFKTTVFTSLEKFDGSRRIKIPPTTYKQGAGRAGRRGIDDIGNVIICPKSDKELKAFRSIIESKDTDIKSAFELSYATLIQTNTLENLDYFIKKSFYTYQSGSEQKIKADIKKKINYLREKGYVYFEDGKFHRTQKGDMARNVYGINQVLFCELINNPKYTQDLTPQELAALMAMFADIKDDKPRNTFDDDLADVAEKLSPAIDLAKEISKEQSQRKINEEIKMSTNLVGAILSFAYVPNTSDQECLDAWMEIFTNLKTKYIIMHEGDLLRVINSTIDLLKTVAEVSEDPELAKKADQAIKCLYKPPITDILKYELNIK